MITKSQVKHIQLLADKKYRHEHRLFVVEGEKMVNELLASGLRIDSLYALPEWIDRHEAMISGLQVVAVRPHELERLSFFKTPNQVVAVANIPVYSKRPPSLCLLLDDIQDPGNLGAIIRIADWYAIPQVYCSPNCVDAFNPKVVQASMGSIFRIPVSYVSLTQLITDHADLAVYAATLDGTDLGKFDPIDKGMILIGSESHGISSELQSLGKYKITIPRKGKAESLNAAVAAGIICHSLLS